MDPKFDSQDEPVEPAEPEDFEDLHDADDSHDSHDSDDAPDDSGDSGDADGSPADPGPAGAAADPGGLRLFEGKPEADEPPLPRRRRRARRVLLWALATMLVLVGVAVGGVYGVVEHYASSVPRIPHAFPSAPASAQPQAVPGSGLNFLLVGLDARAEGGTTGSKAKAPAWQAGAARSDTMMLLHVSDDRKSASLVSLARDTLVDIPGHGRAKINAAYSWGGPALMTETVQNLTGIRIDHIAVIDWNGFRALTDAVGGVDITIPRTIEAAGDGRQWDAGTHHMGGADALQYVRERYGLPGGDLDRTKRQQNFLRSLMVAVMSSGTLTNPARLGGLLQSVGEVVSVDDRLGNSDLYDLAWSLRGLRADDVRFMNAPFGGFDTVGGQDVVLLAEEPARQLWEAVRNDRMAEYFRDHRAGDTLGTDVS